MNRALVIVCALLITIGLSVAGFGSWCLGTAPGARWLMATAGKTAGIEIAAEQLEGSLLAGLDFTGLSVAWQGGGIQADHLRLTMDSSGFWTGKLAVKDLVIDRLVLQTEEDQNQPEPGKPAASGSAASLALAPDWLDLTIAHLQIREFLSKNGTAPGEETVIATLIAGRYKLTRQRLVAEAFSYHSPYVELDGTFDWELTRPRLVMTAQVALPEATADPELFATLRVPVKFPAQFELDGDWNSYTGPVRFGAIDDAGEQTWLSAHATGSWRGVRFEDLLGRYLGGELAGKLALAWDDAFRIDGALSARSVDPGALIEGVTGKTTFDVSGELLIPYDDRPLEASLAAQLYDGRFRDHDLRGRAAAQWVGDALIDLDVELFGDSARLLARGAPAQRVTVDLEVAELAAFHAEVSGRASARGWLRWNEETLTGEIDGQGEGLAWQGTRVSRVEFHARRPADDERIDIKLSGRDWRRGDFRLERLDAEVAGTMAAHRLKFATEGSAGRFAAKGTGSYQGSKWTGRLEQLTGRETPWGSWATSQPAAVIWDNGAISVDQLRLSGDRGARLDLTVDRWGSPGQADVSLVWSDFLLDWLQPYVGLGTLSGRSAGELHYTLNEAGPVSITAQMTARGRVEHELFEVGSEDLAIELDWDRKGLKLAGTASSDTGEAIQAKASAPGPLQWRWPITGLEADLQWQKLDLARLNRFLKDGRLEGLSEGSATLAFTAERLSQLRVHLLTEGRLMQGERELGPRSLTADLNWDAERFQGRAHLLGAKGGHASLQLTAAGAPELSWPESGQIALEIKGLSLAALEPLLPRNIEVSGLFDGHATGFWTNQRTIDLSGKMQLVEGRVGWSGEDGQIRLPLRDAAADWRWAGDSLTGSFAMNLADHGGLKGAWSLPLPARLPTAINQEDPVQLALEGRMQAVGILSSLGPWLVQDIRGETQVSLTLQGTWAKPELGGDIAFTGGGAYLPGAGIQLDDINLRARLASDRIHIEQLEVHSGPGVLNGRGELLFDRWTFAGYRLDVAGKDFQVVDFPELQVLCNPDLELSGTLERLALKGSVLVPVMRIKGSRAAPEVLPSKDVVIATEEKQRRELALATDVHVEVELGEDVTVRAGGVDTRLTGGFILTLGPTGDVLTQGEVQLEAGTYKAYGTTLQIRQGVLSYGGGPLTNPDLRIFAAREVGSVLAGVQVTGSAEAPVVSLYSRPAMPERDILGYILMGRAVRSDTLDADMLMMGAGSLLPVSGEGLSTLGITEIDLQGLFAGLGGVKLRRQFAEKWEIESTLGVESGVDLYYIFEFE